MMKHSAYDHFKNTFESAHGKQQASPFSTLLSAQVDLQNINQYLLFWQKNVDSNTDLLRNTRQWMRDEIDPEVIENKAEIPATYLLGLRNTGCLSAKIPQQYGGLGVSQITFSRLLSLIASHSEVLALVVSVQQLGVVQSLLSAKKLETASTQAQAEKLRKKYLNKLAKSDIGAFSLTTPETGSDPSRLQTIARLSKDQSYFELSGNNQMGGKLFTTLGTIANVYMMLAVVLFDNETLADIEPHKRITAFIVDRDLAGISVQALDFCGWHGLPNAAITLDKVKLNAKNQVGNIGDGLKIAFMNLGSGRINIASISLGMMKQLTRVSCWWGDKRVQGGKSIGQHELNTQQLLSMNAHVYAVESFLQYVSALADQPHADVRLEAAMLKLFSSHALVKIADETLQLRGGRGYESYASQLRRGDTAIPVERLFRSARMMKIGEGGSNILQLYLMRCLVDDFLKAYKKMQDKNKSLWNRLSILLSTASCFIYTSLFPYRNIQGITDKSLIKHIQHVIKKTRALKTLIVSQFIIECFYYGIHFVAHRIKGQSTQNIIKPEQHFEQRQVLLGHCAQIALYLSVMNVTCLRAQNSEEQNALELADEFCIQAQEEIEIHFIQIKNHNRKREKIVTNRGKKILACEYANELEKDILGFSFSDKKDTI